MHQHDQLSIKKKKKLKRQRREGADALLKQLTIASIYIKLRHDSQLALQGVD